MEDIDNFEELREKFWHDNAVYNDTLAMVKDLKEQIEAYDIRGKIEKSRSQRWRRLYMLTFINLLLTVLPMPIYIVLLVLTFVLNLWTAHKNILREQQYMVDYRQLNFKYRFFRGFQESLYPTLCEERKQYFDLEKQIMARKNATLLEDKALPKEEETIMAMPGDDAPFSEISKPLTLKKMF